VACRLAVRFREHLVERFARFRGAVPQPERGRQAELRVRRKRAVGLPAQHVVEGGRRLGREPEVEVQVAHHQLCARGVGELGYGAERALVGAERVQRVLEAGGRAQRGQVAGQVHRRRLVRLDQRRTGLHLTDAPSLERLPVRLGFGVTVLGRLQVGPHEHDPVHRRQRARRRRRRVRRARWRR